MLAWWPELEPGYRWYIHPCIPWSLRGFWYCQLCCTSDFMGWELRVTFYSVLFLSSGPLPLELVGKDISFPRLLPWQVMIMKSTQNSIIPEDSSVMGMPWYVPVTLLLHWSLSICFWVWFKVLVIIHKAMHGILSGYLRDHLSPIVSAQPLQSYRVDGF